MIQSAKDFGLLLRETSSEVPLFLGTFKELLTKPRSLLRRRAKQGQMTPASTFLGINLVLVEVLAASRAGDSIKWPEIIKLLPTDLFCFLLGTGTFLYLLEKQFRTALSKTMIAVAYASVLYLPIHFASRFFGDEFGKVFMNFATHGMKVSNTLRNDGVKLLTDAEWNGALFGALHNSGLGLLLRIIPLAALIIWWIALVDIGLSETLPSISNWTRRRRLLSSISLYGLLKLLSMAIAMMYFSAGLAADVVRFQRVRDIVVREQFDGPAALLATMRVQDSESLPAYYRYINAVVGVAAYLDSYGRTKVVQDVLPLFRSEQFHTAEIRLRQSLAKSTGNRSDPDALIDRQAISMLDKAQEFYKSPAYIEARPQSIGFQLYRAPLRLLP